MPDALIQRKRDEREQEIVLRLLEEVASDEGLSQARFAQRIGIAKGLANSYFNRCLQKGWIKLRQVPKQRFLYYLTPKGFAEKASLTAQFLSASYQFYRDARSDLGQALQHAAAAGHTRLAVLGDGELAEIAAIICDECGIEIVAFVMPSSKRKSVAGHSVVSSWTDVESADGVLLATVEDAKKIHGKFTRNYPEVPVYVPGQLEALVWDR
ncbi:MAG: winged helix-turn-helix transcriptional regulator [Hyphomicrobiaceae bacterium]|nr:winged helix-turn-helix transcriptional regulator [Hyphomicrobiaceae bacterium]